jgi:hypothetical protein
MIFSPLDVMNPDNLAKSRNAEHPPLRFQQLTRPVGVVIAFFAITTILNE